MAEKDRERLMRAWDGYQERRRAADERRLEANDRALEQLTEVIGSLRGQGYSLSDLGRELGMTRQAVHDLLRRAQAPR